MPIQNGTDPTLELPQDNAVGWGATIRAAFNALNAGKANVGHTHTGFANSEHQHPELEYHNHDDLYASAAHNHAGQYAQENHNHAGLLAPLNHTHSEFALLGSSSSIIARIEALEAIIKPSTADKEITVSLQWNTSTLTEFIAIITLSSAIKVDYYTLRVYYAGEVIYKCESKDPTIKIEKLNFGATKGFLAIARPQEESVELQLIATAKTYEGGEITSALTPFILTLI